MPQETKPVQIFAGDFHRASIIKNMLENHGIYVFVQNEHMGSIAPWQVASGGFNPVKLIVSGLDSEQALRLLEEFNSDLPE
ncbi:putative signal transducing protein [Pontibacter sp. MBLB2868]|uniref:putative signal transducing protein n=1 Tax=Pontibacter sp. MBLB2868 TaxID=3451555 RepID=UPI003F7526A2